MLCPIHDRQVKEELRKYIEKQSTLPLVCNPFEVQSKENKIFGHPLYVDLLLHQY